jgi:hypothetical protein
LILKRVKTLNLYLRMKTTMEAAMEKLEALNKEENRERELY